MQLDAHGCPACPHPAIIRCACTCRCWIGVGKPASMILTAYECRDLRDSAEAQFHLNSVGGREAIRDYTLAYTVTVEEAG